MRAEQDDLDELRADVDFSEGVRAKFAGRPGRGVLTVTLDADVAQVFSSADEVNRALRMMMKTSVAADPRIERKAS